MVVVWQNSFVGVFAEVSECTGTVLSSLRMVTPPIDQEPVIASPATQTKMMEEPQSAVSPLLSLISVVYWWMCWDTWLYAYVSTNTCGLAEADSLQTSTAYVDGDLDCISHGEEILYMLS